MAAVVPGTSTSLIANPTGRWAKPMSHPTVFNPVTRKWMGILPTASGWTLYEDLENPVAGAVLDTTWTRRPSILADIGDGQMAVFWSGSSSLIAKSSWSTPATVTTVTQPLVTTDHDVSPVQSVMTPEGLVWSARGNTGVVRAARQQSDGLTPTPSQIGTFGSVQSGMIGLRNTGTKMLSLSNGNDSSGRSAKVIERAAADIAQANWTVETLPAFAAGTSSDDHLSMTSLPDGTVYAAAKTTNAAGDLPLIYVLRRTPAGVWSSSVVETGPDDDGGTTPGYTRPSVQVIDGVVNVFYTSIYSIAGISRRTAPLDLSSWSARSTFMAGSGLRDGALLPDVVPADAARVPVLAHDATAQNIQIEWLTQVVPEDPATFIGNTAVQDAYMGSTAVPASYMGSTEVI